MDRQTNRYDGKQYLPATSLAGGTNDRNNSYCIQYCFLLILSFHTAISHFNVCRFIIISVVTLSEITNIKELKNPHAGLFILLSVADLGFPRRGGANSPGEAPTYDFAKISQKLHEIERIWTPRGGRASKILLCRSATGYCEMMIPSPVQVKPQMMLWVMSQVTP